jgi:hypothetical protein
MQSEFQAYSNSDNLEAIRALSRDIVHSVEPEEDISAKKLVDRLVKGCEEGKLPVADNDAERAGGFGGIDLITLVVVPLVVAVLKKICDELVEWSFEKMKIDLKKNIEKKVELSKKIDYLVEEQYIIVSEKVRSKKSRRKEKIIKQTTKVSIKKMLNIES